MGIDAETIVIGAGLAGLRVAQGLAAAGGSVAVIEKSRGTGGRLATRRAGALRFDHGAQYLTATVPGFAAWLAGAAEAGAAAGWPSARDGAMVGLPGMSGIVKPMAGGLALHPGTRVGRAERAGGVWRLTDPDGAPIGACARLVVATPAPQARAILAGHRLAAALDAVEMAPNWTLMAAFADPLPLPGTARAEGEALSWIARDSAKPGRGDGPECWVAQASEAWSRARLEHGEAEIAAEMLALLAARAGRALPAPVHAAAHRWRYAYATRPLGRPCLHDPAEALTLVGDWCLGRKAEQAWLSAEAALALIGAEAAA